MEKLNQTFLTYYDYIEEIRKRLYRVAIIFFIFFIIAFIKAGAILKWIIGIFNLKDVAIVTTSPFQFLDLATKIGAYSGLFICMPFVIYYVYDFLKDGLSEREKKLFFVLLPTGLILFTMGFMYCFGILFFYLNTVSVLNLSFGIQNVWDINTFLSQVIIASICFGLVFQFPIILTFLIRIGMLNIDTLRNNRLYIICGIFIFVGFLPPPEIFSTLIQAFPLITLYQLTLWGNQFFDKIFNTHVNEEKIAYTEITT